MILRAGRRHGKDNSFNFTFVNIRSLAAIITFLFHHSCANALTQRDILTLFKDDAGHMSSSGTTKTYYIQRAVFRAHIDRSTVVDPFLDGKYITIMNMPTDVVLNSWLTRTTLGNGQPIYRPTVSI